MNTRRWIGLLFATLLGVVTANAQTVSFPHEVFDPLNIPQVEGAKLLYADKGSADSYPLVIYNATPQQVMAWIEQMDNRGFLHRNRHKESKKQILRGSAYRGGIYIEYYFPVGTSGDKQSIYAKMQCRFDDEIVFREGKGMKVPGSSMAIELTPFTRTKQNLNYQKGILKDMGITDESGFIPKHTEVFKTNVLRSDKYVYSQLPAGTPYSGILEAKFCAGYIPTFADVRAWANKLYKACTANASSIDPISENEGTGMTHWWTYTCNGVKYQCHVEADLDLFGRFVFTATRVQ